MGNLEACIVEIKQAIARIEEQTKTIFRNLNEYKERSERLHSQHTEKANNHRTETSEFCRSLDVRVSRHDVDIDSIRKTLDKLEPLLQQIAQSSAKTKGIALGLGMAGGAIVTILTILIRILK